MTAKDALSQMIAGMDEAQATDCLVRLRPLPSELLAMDDAERAFWYSILIVDIDMDELSEWDAGTLSDVDLVDE